MLLKKKKRIEEMSEQAKAAAPKSWLGSSEETIGDAAMTAEGLMWEIINEFTQTKIARMADIRKNEEAKKRFLQEVREHLERFYLEYSALFEEALQLIDSYIFGYYRLTPLIADETISDIKILDYNNIRIKRKGKREAAQVQFKDREEYLNFVSYVATKNQVSVSNINALQIFSDNVGDEKFILRFVVSMPIITMPGVPYMAIRKVPRDFPEMEDLVKVEMMDENLKKYLVERFLKHSMLICGPSASGKTTLLNAVKETAPEDSSCLIVQETEELTSKNHPDMLFEHPLVNRGESKIQYTLYDIIAAGLLMDIERFIVGEIKGGEAMHLLNASYTGHLCAATIHAESAHTALDKLVDYAKYKTNYSKAELMKMVASFKTIVFIRDFKVAEVVEVTGWDYNKMEPVYRSVYQNEEELYV